MYGSLLGKTWVTGNWNHLENSSPTWLVPGMGNAQDELSWNCPLECLGMCLWLLTALHWAFHLGLEGVSREQIFQEAKAEPKRILLTFSSKFHCITSAHFIGHKQVTIAIWSTQGGDFYSSFQWLSGSVTTAEKHVGWEILLQLYWIILPVTGNESTLCYFLLGRKAVWREIVPQQVS